MLRTIAAAFTAIALTFPAIAAEPGGTVTGTVEGQEVELSISANQSDFDGKLSERWITVSLYATGPALHEWGIGPLSISFDGYDLLAGGFSHILVYTTISDTSPRRIYAAEYSEHGLENGDLELTITSAAQENGVLSVSGTVTGTLVSVEWMGHRNPDPDNTLGIALTFDAIVEQLSGE